MMLTRGKLACGAGLLAVLAFGSVAGADTTLRYKFKQGDKLNYVMDQKMGMELPGGAGKMDMNIAIEMSWNVQSVDKDGKAKIAQKFERIKFTMAGIPGAPALDYDSKDKKQLPEPFGQMMGPMFDAMSSAEFIVTMAPNGEISDVVIPEKLKQAVAKAGAGGALPGMDFSPDGMKRMMSQSGLVLPKDPVAKGKSWDQKLEMPAPGLGSMVMENKYTYEGPTTKNGKTLEQVGLKPTMTFKGDANAPVKMSLKDAKGTAYFDNDAGRLVEMTMNQDMVMEAAGQNMTMKQTVTMKLKDK